MKTIAIVTALPPSEVTLNEYGFHLVSAFHKTAENVKIITFADQNDLSNHALEKFTGVFRVWRFNSIFTPVKILLSALKHKPDFVLFNAHVASFGTNELTAGCGLISPIILKIFGFKSGVILHNVLDNIDLEKSSPRSRWRKALIRFSHKLVAKLLLSADYLTVTMANYKVSLSKHGKTDHVHHVPHGTFEDILETSPQLADRPQNFITFGKFGTYKKLDTLLQAFSILKSDSNFGHVELHIGGSDHQNAPGYIQDVMTKNSFQESIKYHGYISEEDLNEFWGRGLCCVFDYSTTTGSSGVLSQVMAKNLLPLFPDIDDFKLIKQEEGFIGAHFSPGDAQDLANMMKRVLEQTVNFQSIVDHNQKLMATEALSMEAIAKKHLSFMNMNSGCALNKEHKPGSKNEFSFKN